MNIFLFELKAQLKGFLVWTATIIITLLLFLMGIFPVFNASLDDVLKVLSGFPPEFAAAFGMDIAMMFGFGGFYSFAFSYTSLVGAIMAVWLGLSVFARERRSKCLDFLLAKPISRENIFLAKLLTCLLLLVVMNVLYCTVTIIIGVSNGETISRMFLASLSLLLTQLVFLSISVLFSVLAKRIRSVSGIATAVGFAGFILSALVNILEDDKVRFIAPLKYFDPTPLFSDGSFELVYALTGVAVIVVCLAVGFVRFCKSDAHAV